MLIGKRKASLLLLFKIFIMKFKTNYIQFAHDEYIIAWPSADNVQGDDLETLNTWFNGDECTRTLIFCKSDKQAKNYLKQILCKK